MKSTLFLLFLLIPVQLFAHAEEPAARSIFKTDSGILIQANFGIIADSINGYVCEEAFLGGDTWKVGVFSETEWVTFGSDNIKKTEDGCSFETIKEIDSIVGDMRVSPDKKTVAYFSNGGSDPGIWISKDRGRSFVSSNYNVDSLQVTGLRFQNNSTLLVSAYDTTKEGLGLLISISTQSLESERLNIPNQVTFPYILDANENGIVWLGRLAEQTIFIGTKTNTDELRYTPKSWPTGAALSADGQTVYIGGVNEGTGIAVGQRTTGIFETIMKDQAVDCLNRVGEKIYTCGLERRDGFDVFELENNTLKGVSKFTNINGPRNNCPKNSEVNIICPVVWSDTADYFGKDPDLKTADVGTDVGADVLSDMGGREPNNPVESSGCSTIHSTSFSFFFLVALLFVRKRN